MVKNERFLVLGMMSGTSLDGLDLVLSDFQKKDNCWGYQVKKATTIPYPKALRMRLANAMRESAVSFVKLDIELGEFMADAVNVFLSDVTEKPFLLASHGHTVFHQPQESFSTQIGSGAVLSARTGIRTVCDFRSKDVALGGQGAPLVPVGDEWLFSHYDFCLNLGGFCNISFRRAGVRHAFDIAPCNMALNILANECGQDFDENGALARQGVVNKLLFTELNQLAFYQLGNVSKSLGKEWFDDIFFPVISKYAISVKDKLRTAIEHIAYQITKVINEEIGTQVLVTGGGALNTFLVETIRKNTTKNICLPDEETINYKEAIIFAFLGLLRWQGEINVLHQVTGAMRDSSSGAIY